MTPPYVIRASTSTTARHASFTVVSGRQEVTHVTVHRRALAHGWAPALIAQMLDWRKPRPDVKP